MISTTKQIFENESVNFLSTNNISRTYNQQINPSAISELYLDEETADVHFLINKNQRIPAHKCILSASSTVFRQMLYGPLRETAAINITDDFIAVDNVFKEFLKIFYLCDIHIQSENVIDMFLLADKYDVPKLKEFCYHFLTYELTINIFFRAYELVSELAMKFDLSGLKTLCCDKIRLQADDLLISPYIAECSRETLKDIVKWAGLYCNEIFILEALMEWAKKSCEYRNIDPNSIVNCREALGDVLDLINFSDMAAEEFELCQQKYANLLSTEESEKIIHTITVRYEPSDIFVILVEVVADLYFYRNDDNFGITSIETISFKNVVECEGDEIEPFNFEFLRIPLWRSVYCYGYRYPSIIQRYAIPICIKKRNVFFQAPFGNCT